MAKWAQGIFTPKNPTKYIGKGSVRYRSSWELAFCNFCDNHPSIINWASESIRIPYVNPLTNKNTIYVPDFLIVYQDKAGNKRAEVIEIKPSSQKTIEGAGRNKNNQAAVAVNIAKWQAAAVWCAKQGISFRVISEQELFAGAKKR